MAFKEPTFEEYQKAAAFAKFKYKYGIFIIILCWICLIYICFFLVVKGDRIARNPLVYGADELDVECRCYSNNFKNSAILENDFYVNGSAMWVMKIYNSSALEGLIESIDYSQIKTSEEDYGNSGSD